MQIKYQLIFKIVLAWNMAYYQRIRNLSLSEVELFMNSPLLPEMVKGGEYADRIEIIPESDYDPHYLIKMKTYSLCEFKIPQNIRLIKTDEIMQAFHWLRDFIQAGKLYANNMYLLN